MGDERDQITTQPDLGRREAITASSVTDALPPEAAAERGDDPLLGWLVDGRYQVTGLIAVGGMGAVYEARDTEADRRVAIKTLQPRFAEQPRVVQRFVREAEVLARSRSPHVVLVWGDGRLPDGRAYYVMEYLEGESLADVLERTRGPLDPVRAVKIGLELAAALEHAHALGLVHRDLKPENIFLCRTEEGEERVKVLDFGLAKALDGSMDVTKAGEVLGTPGYMAPEQIRGATMDERTDVYAAGVVIYEMLTGRMPFDGDAIVDIMLAHVEEPVPLPSELDPPVRLPVLLEWIAMCCLYKEPERRFQTAAELRAELENAARLYHIR
ncbi:MAG TPA: serine/threonine-protein kinase [Sandaracinaceae bacterium LLY-WYZ-13_1]|nr:serine/threonine-protein kinase [Sandaracinaceae bacterium LLY-WYZ-13_1]